MVVYQPMLEDGANSEITRNNVEVYNYESKEEIQLCPEEASIDPLSMNNQFDQTPAGEF